MFYDIIWVSPMVSEQSEYDTHVIYYQGGQDHFCFFLQIGKCFSLRGGKIGRDIVLNGRLWLDKEILWWRILYLAPPRVKPNLQCSDPRRVKDDWPWSCKWFEGVSHYRSSIFGLYLPMNRRGRISNLKSYYGTCRCVNNLRQLVQSSVQTMFFCD